MRTTRATRRCLVIALLCCCGVASADEGMWPLNHLPVEHLERTYGFKPSDDWIERIQNASLRVSTGGSASFVSSNGLVMTNHHVASDAIADLSSADRDLMADGYVAQTVDDELKCHNLKLYRLVSIEDVTDRVNAGITAATDPQAARGVREQHISEIQSAAEARSGLQPEVVTLYRGARYHLYLYKVYDDVRLAMAPEAGIGFFGGDVDNFGYPRYNLDVTFFRAYEDGRPARTPHFLPFGDGQLAENDLVFMSGNPARTRRSYSVRHLEFLRDIDLPLTLSVYNQREVALGQFVMGSAENRRIGREPLLGTQNGRKAFGGILGGLLDPAIMDGKRAAEKTLREFVAADPARQTRYGSAWSDLEQAIGDLEGYYTAYWLMENRRSSLGTLAGVARMLVRGSGELAKGDAARLPEYRTTQLPSLEGRLFSEAPVYPNLERLLLTDGLTRMARLLGGDHPVVRTALAGRSPAQRAADVLKTTRLADVSYRRELWAGGASAVAASGDPLIVFARALEPMARTLRDRYDTQFAAVETAAYARIAQAAFDLHGDSVYPDATYTVRLSYGTVKGYEENDLRIPPMTRMSGAFEHAKAHGFVDPFRLPDSWMKNKSRMNLDTPFNFVSTNDIIGGNSGSPAFDRSGNVVGIVFDGNIQSLVWDIAFTDREARSVSVHVSAIIEALDKVYGAQRLVNELRSPTSGADATNG